MDRRTFLKNASAGVLGLGALRPLHALAEETAPAAEAPAPPRTPTLPTNWTWARVRADWDQARRIQFLDEVVAAGITGLLCLNGGDREMLALAAKRDVQVHAWRWTLCRPALAEEHPEWFVVSRKGESTAEKPPYVHYYRFLCPSREDVVDYLVDDYAEIAGRDGVAGVHLDYVRYPDVILPKALWAKYDLVQTEELPEFDFCYCDVCRAAFHKQAGVDPLELPDPPADPAWRQYRYDTVTRMVNRIADAVRARSSVVTAAVFPTPTIARTLVRQDWTRWKVDAVMPMVYNHFYEKDVAWIEGAVREGAEALDGARPLYAGLYVSALKDDESLAAAVNGARSGGAAGIALFGGVRPLPQ